MNKTMDFEEFVLEWLENHREFNLWWMSDFYEEACDNLNLDFDDIFKNQAKIRPLLLKMKKKGLIDSRRVGSGFLGKTDFGSCHHNCYTLPNFWLS